MTDLVSPSPVDAAGASGGTPTVVVVDADDRTRASLVGLLEVHGRCRVVGSAGRADDALPLIRRAQPEVVVVDPRLPEVESGLALIRRIRSSAGRVRILGMSSMPDLEGDIRAAGADAFVRKTFRPQELADAVGRCAGAAHAKAIQDLDG